MARPSVAARNLSLTEELEKLEQSITLTLQGDAEIDHNFSKSHRIVTTSILPLVEQYGEHSRAFWKQFFEASANVSLSGYEEANNDGDTTGNEESTVIRDDSEVEQTPRRGEDVTTETGADQSTFQGEGEESLLDDAELAGSTPRPPATKTQIAPLDSPYESMRREMRDEDGDNTTVLGDGDDDSTVLFAQRTARLPDLFMTPQALLDRQANEQSGQQRPKDPLLHRVLDKNYRVQATPHKPALRLSPLKGKEKETPGAGGLLPSWNQDSPMSSPEIAAPKLRSEAFMSPYKKSTARQRLAATTQQKGGGPRTPGVSVQTPATARKTRDVFAEEEDAAAAAGKRGDRVKIDWDIGEEVDEDDVDLYAGMSPPKTIQFALPPSKLLQTPAREASRRIVDDILLDAGVDPESSEYSPTMVKMNEDILNDSF
ncbi:DASH complex subunit-like protein [Hapsidospora chrysogenum ATCC 11550]|uniref:DASH complex subunit ASK1 n=1 Tax=Hapsidospora chrysogenum (strain ATCC 11550 / CBS 779.69 / DSM 880 / IAM 14645 / JCM 23072 / IMI 49137) TaxID=857340 RepID=A0A086TEJ1_HAPC1|nr:DASH complex subunit-like protein [Hapsidospora chrysogenum ATCC 11550]